MTVRRPGAAKYAMSGPQSVARITGILELLAVSRAGEGLTSISHALRAPKTSLVGLLKGLQQLEYIVRKDDRYLLGPAASALAMSVIPGRNVVYLARPLLRQLARETEETALLGVLSSAGDSAIYLDSVESDNPVRYSVPIGAPRDLYCSAVGKCILAYLDEDRLARYLQDHRLLPHTPKTITSVPRLLEELKRIRAAGVALSEGERIPGVSAVAAPVLSGKSELIAALVIGAAADRVRTRKRLYREATIAAAKELSRNLMFLGAERLPK